MKKLYTFNFFRGNNYKKLLFLALSIALNWSTAKAQQFTKLTLATLPTGVYQGSASWADYDNDGKLDFILTGTTNGTGNITEIWHNDGGTFSN